MKYLLNSKNNIFKLNAVIAALVMSVTHALAQKNANNENNIAKEREQTKNMIENVTADQKGQLDTANTLGQRLNKNINKKRKELTVDTAIEQVDKVKTDSQMTPVILGQWPTLLSPNDKKLLVNPRPRGMRNDDGSLVYTPDFSRQRLTMGLLNNYHHSRCRP